MDRTSSTANWKILETWSDTPWNAARHESWDASGNVWFIVHYCPDLCNNCTIAYIVYITTTSSWHPAGKLVVYPDKQGHETSLFIPRVQPLPESWVMCCMFPIRLIRSAGQGTLPGIMMVWTAWPRKDCNLPQCFSRTLRKRSLGLGSSRVQSFLRQRSTWSVLEPPGVRMGEVTSSTSDSMGVQLKKKHTH